MKRLLILTGCMCVAIAIALGTAWIVNRLGIHGYYAGYAVGMVYGSVIVSLFWVTKDL